MYDELVKELRDSAEWADRLALLMGRAEGDAHAPVMRKAADTIEELSRAADAIPHVCECCIGCEVESGGCDNAFVLSPKRAKEYLSKPRWIPVTERLPKAERKSYWVCTDTGYQCQCRWSDDIFGIGAVDNWSFSIFDIPQYQKVVAWMPLPCPYEPPKEET